MSAVKVLITGSAGTIGTVLRAGLDAQIGEFDLPDDDARDYARVAARSRAQHAIVHLAWNTALDNWRSGTLDPDNIRAAHNVYRAALALGVPRVLLASSIHADDYPHASPQAPLRADRLPWPTSPYGAAKCAVEALGRHYCTRGLDVVCVRFGAVNPDDRAPEQSFVWLAHADCVSLIQAVLDAPPRSGAYAVINAVSDNEGRVHNLSNAFGWKPAWRGDCGAHGFERHPM